MTRRKTITDPLAAAWVEHLQATNTPPNTVARRASTLRAIPAPSTATREDIEAWWLTRSYLAPATRANDLATLRALYKWAQRWEHRADDPTLRIDAPRVPNGLPRPMSRTDLQTLKDTLPPDLRRAICLGAYAGLRVSEAAALRWDDMDTDRYRARIMNSKGGKSRLVAISPLLLDELLPDTGANVVTGDDRTHTPASLQRRINRAIRRAGVDATFHKLRHRYGTLAYQATGDLVAVARQMGHSSVVTTAIYAAASAEVADKIAAAVVR